MLKAHIKRTIIFAILGAVIAFVVTQISPKIYEGRLEMLLSDETRNQNLGGANIFTPDVLDILQRNRPQGAATERQLLSSQSVFFQALVAVATAQGNNSLVEKFSSLYPMYDIETARTTNQQVDAGVALLRVRAEDPQLAADLANQIAVTYNEVRLRNSRESTQEALNYLQAKMKTAEQDLRNAESKFKDFKVKENIADMVKAMTDETSLLTSLQQRKTQIEAELSGARSALASARAQLNSTPTTEIASTTDGRGQQVSEYEAQLVRARTDLDRLLAVYLPDAPQVVQAQELVTALEKKLEQAKKETPQSFASKTTTIKALRQDLERQVATQTLRVQELESQQTEVNRQIGEQQTKVNSLPGKQVELQQLERELRIFEEGYQQLRRMTEDLRTRSETAVRAALVLNTAVKDDVPVAPDMKKNLVIGATAGICIGLLFSYVLESLRLRIQSSTQLTALTGLPVVAAIPAGAKTGAKALRLIGRPEVNPPEAFRYMAFSLVTNSNKTMRTFMFTGIKTAMTTYSSATQFALAVARGGARVLLVDADMLKSPISKALDAGGRTGMSNLLASETSMEVKDLIVETVHPNLLLLPGGNDPSMRFLTNAPRPKLEAVFQSVRLACDVVVFAVPPCDVLADASCLAGLVDDTCLVVSAAQTNYRAVPLAQDLLTKAGAKNISIVMADASADEEPFAKRSAYLTRAN